MTRLLQILVLAALAFALWCAAPALTAIGQEPGCQYQEWQPPNGSVLLSVNTNGDNRSAGYWNHSAIVSNGYVIEAQTGLYGNGVQRTSLAAYRSRPYQLGILYPRDPYLGERAAAIAETYVGRPYRRASSLAPALIPPIVPRLIYGTPYGMNCVSVVRDSYEAALGQPLYGMRTPDDICRRGDLFTNQPPQPAMQPQPIPPQQHEVGP